MSENIDMGLALKKFIPFNEILIEFSKNIKDLTMQPELYYLEDWNFDVLFPICNEKHIEELINQKKIVYAIFSNDLISYYYQEKNDYIFELSVSDDLNNSLSNGNIIEELYNKIKSIFDIDIRYAYVGKETYIEHLDDYKKMVENSTGVVKWVFN